MTRAVSAPSVWSSGTPNTGFDPMTSRPAFVFGVASGAPPLLFVVVFIGNIVRSHFANDGAPPAVSDLAYLPPIAAFALAWVPAALLGAVAGAKIWPALRLKRYRPSVAGAVTGATMALAVTGPELALFEHLYFPEEWPVARALGFAALCSALSLLPSIPWFAFVGVVLARRMPDNAEAHTSEAGG